MLTQSSFLRFRPLSTHGLASKRPAAKFLGLILFEPKKSVKKFKVRTSLPTQCPHTSTVTFGPGVLSNKITSSCAWLSGARYCPRHGKPAVLGLHRCVRGFPRSFSKSRDRVIFFSTQSNARPGTYIFWMGHLSKVKTAGHWLRCGVLLTNSRINFKGAHIGRILPP